MTAGFLRGPSLTSLHRQIIFSSLCLLFLDVRTMRFWTRFSYILVEQGSGKMESEVSCPEVGTGSVRSPKSVMSNGNLQARNDGSVVETASLNKKTDRHAVLPRNASGAAEAGVQIPNRRKGRSSEFDQSESGHPSRKETETGKRGKHRRSSNEKLPSASQPKHSHGKMKIHVSGDAGVPLKKRGRKPRVDVSDDTPITELVSKIKKQRGRVSNSEKVSESKLCLLEHRACTITLCRWSGLIAFDAFCAEVLHIALFFDNLGDVFFT